MRFPKLTYENFEAETGARWPLQLSADFLCVNIAVRQDRTPVFDGSRGMVGMIGGGSVTYEADFFHPTKGETHHLLSRDGQNWMVTAVTADPNGPSARRGRVARMPRDTAIETVEPRVSQAEAEARVEALGAQLDQLKLPD